VGEGPTVGPHGRGESAGRACRSAVEGVEGDRIGSVCESVGDNRLGGRKRRGGCRHEDMGCLLR